MLGQIFLNESGRFQIDTRELTSGDTLEVLVVDGQSEKPSWIDTSVEHDGQSYYLTGLYGYSPLGLFARI